MDDHALRKTELASVERRIAQAEQAAAHQREVVGRLEAAGLRHSETAEPARDLLRQISGDLRGYNAERKRLRAHLHRRSRPG